MRRARPTAARSEDADGQLADPPLGVSALFFEERGVVARLLPSTRRPEPTRARVGLPEEPTILARALCAAEASRSASAAAARSSTSSF